MVIVSDGMLREFVTEILKAAGTPVEEAAWVADCLVLSNLKGVDSHGVQQIPGYVRSIQDGRLKPGAELTLLKEKAATALFDGGGGFGYTMAREAMKVTIEKAREAGVAYSGVRNLHHIGRVGRWAEMALEEEMIGIASQPGGVYVAPWGGIDRKLPIAPIAVAVPAGKHKPIVVDMSLGPTAGREERDPRPEEDEAPAWVDGRRRRKTSERPGNVPAGRGRPAPPRAGRPRLQGDGPEHDNRRPLGAPPRLHGHQGVAVPAEGHLPGSHQRRGVHPLRRVQGGRRRHHRGPQVLEARHWLHRDNRPGEPEWREQERRLREGIYIDDEIYRRILDTAEKVGVDTTKYKGKPGRLEITHPSYTLKDRYE